MEEVGCWSDVLFLMESRGFSKADAAELALQIFNWGIRAAIERMKPSRPNPSDLPDMAAQLQLTVEGAGAAQAKAKKKEPSKGLHRIPADFALDDDMRAFATDRAFPPKAIDAMWMKFFNHYRANGQTAVDWRAKWRTWVMKTVEFNTRDGRTPGGEDTTRGGFL